MIRTGSVALALLVTSAGPVLAQRDLPVTVAGLASPPSYGMKAVAIDLRFQGPIAERLDVIRLVRTSREPDWRLADISQVEVVRGTTVVRGYTGLDTLLLIRAAMQPGYLIAGPFRWPPQGEIVDIPQGWRRTVRGRGPLSGAASPVWLGRADEGSPSMWPRCGSTPGAVWECVGVPIAAPGVVVSTGPGRINFAVARGVPSAAGVEVVSLVSAVWGRLLIIGRTDRAAITRADALAVNPRKLQVPHARMPPSRAQTEADTRILAEKIAEGVFWVSGNETPSETWIEITGAGRAPVRLVVPVLADTPGEIPLHVDLEDAGVIAGRVTGANGEPASGAIVTLYRLLPDSRTDKKRPPRRVTVAEVTTGAEGEFRYVDVAREQHELLALHAELGRGDRSVEADSLDVQVVLRPPSRATGRVLREGVPAAGVPIATVPDIVEFATTEDVTELFGGEARSDRDGRFVVSLPSRGIAELRVGDDTWRVRRLLLGVIGSLPSVVDVGTIDLTELPPLTFVLEDSGGCDVVVSGPIGHSGVTAHRATRLGPAMFRTTLPEPGSWLISATCAGRSRDVVPPVVEITAGTGERTVRLVWR